MCELQNWSEQYNQVIDNPPKEGDVLSTLNGEPAKLNIELVEGSPPFIYGRAYVPEIVGSEIAWCLQSETIESYHGWKCILMPRARGELIRKCGLTGDTVIVKSLRVVRPSQSGKSLLCEIGEYCDIETENVEDVLQESL